MTDKVVLGKFIRRDGKKCRIVQGQRPLRGEGYWIEYSTAGGWRFKEWLGRSYAQG